MGRRAQPVSILQATGRKHLTKAEIENRKEVEIKLGNTKLICPGYIKNNINAYVKWKEMIKIYKEVDFVSSSDTSLLARYCMTHSEYLNLCETRNRIGSLRADWSQYEDGFPEEFQKNIEALLRLNSDLSLESAINKKMDMLIKMEDRLFLNPLAKIKNIPKKEPTKVDPVKNRFGNI